MSEHTVRLLPKEEYERIADFPGPLRELQGVPDPVHTRLVVVEDEGKVVGYWMLFDTVHAEPLWLDPTIRHQPKVALELLQQISDELHVAGAQTIFAVIGEPERAVMEPLARKVGLVPIAGTLFGGTLNGNGKDSV